MKSNISFQQRLLVALTVTTVLVLAACGGGGGNPLPPPSGEAPPVVKSVAGTITGFGSVIIDGVEYDDSKAMISVDTDPAAPTQGTLSDLKLGMSVEAKVLGGKLSDVVVHSTLLGPISALDAATSSFTLYGQQVKVMATSATPTIFEGVQDFGGLAVGDVVEVHGTVDASKAIIATRVERRPQTELAKGVRIGGVITALNATAKTFKFNDMTVDYSTATVLPQGATPSNGQLVVVFSDTPPGASGLKAKAVKLVTTTDGTEFGVGGRIMAFTSSSDFTVSGVRVDASVAAFVGGTAADLGLGVIVGVEGHIASGVLKATKVRVLKTPADVQASLSGQVTDWVSVSSFKVRGVPVDASTASFTGGTAADLGNGAWVVVSGKVQGSVLQAAKVEFKTPPVTQPVKLMGEIRDYNATAGTFHFLGVTLKLGTAVEYVNGTAGNLANGRRVAVAGTPGADGVVVVKRLEFLPDLAPQVSVVGGRAFDVTASGFKLPGIAVTFNANTVFDGGGAQDLANGALVLAKGSYNPATKAIAATWIEIVKLDANAPRAAGPVSDFVSPGNFRIGGQLVDASGASFVDGTAADLVNGAIVEAVGKLNTVGDGKMLIASKLRFLTK